MRIVINLLNFRPGRIGGTETYVRELVAHLPELTHENETTLLCDRDVAPQFASAGLSLAVVGAGTKAVAAQRFLEAVSPYRALRVERAIARLNADVMLFPQQAMFPKHVECARVLVVHDLYHVQLPENLSSFQRLYRRAIYGWSVAQADSIIAISEFTRKSVIAHYGLGEPQRVHTVRHGCRAAERPDEPPAANCATGPAYVYYPAVSHPHKNHLQLLLTVAALRARGEFPYRLVLSGTRTAHWRVLQAEIRRLGLGDIVTHAGFVPFEQVRELYRGARAVVFPSSYEGFGIPVAEAIAHGKSLITSDIEVFRELGVPASCRIDFADPAALSRALQQTGPTVLERALPTWRDTARATLELLRQTAIAARPIPFQAAEPATPEPVRLANAA
ncbi:MAG: glycosyltransferase family 4 protein [Planctomycetaceae bacterium]